MSNNNTDNNKRIAKNTVYLYIRMLFTAFISLYTARLVLKVLGVEDYGIYNVVGGVVTFMGFFTATMSSATQRFLTYYLGTGESVKYCQTFSLLINLYLIFCAIAFVTLEIVGPIYISRYMTIPYERIIAAQWVFQFSLLTFLANTITVPFRSSIVAYEKMGVYAYIGIVEAVLNLLIVIFLPFIHYDGLIWYSVFVCLTQLGIVIAIVLYCRYHLANCRYVKYWNSKYVKELLTYSGWNLFGSTTGVLNLQGQAIVLNCFFGPIVNAAKAIADRVNGMITQFSQNFYMAVAPQIIKSYAAGNIEYMRSLVLNSTRYSFLMLYVISVPLIVAMSPILEVWLGKEQVTIDMIRFCQCTIIYSLVNILEQPITMAVRATGNIKKYQVYVGLLTLSFIPFCVVLFLFGTPSYMSMLLLSFIYLLALWVRIKIVSPYIKIKPIIYFKEVLLPLIITIIMSFIIIVLIDTVKISEAYDDLLKGGISFVVVTIIGFLIGLNKSERQLGLSYLFKLVKHI